MMNKFKQENVFIKQKKKLEDVLEEHINKNSIDTPNADEFFSEERKKVLYGLLDDAHGFMPDVDYPIIESLKDKINSVENKESFVIQEALERLKELKKKSAAYESEDEIREELRLIKEKLAGSEYKFNNSEAIDAAGEQQQFNLN